MSTNYTSIALDVNWYNNYDVPYYSILYCCIAAAGLAFLLVGSICCFGKRDLPALVKALSFVSGMIFHLVLVAGQLAASIVLMQSFHFSSYLWWSASSTADTTSKINAGEHDTPNGGIVLFVLCLVALCLSVIFFIVGAIWAVWRTRKIIQNNEVDEVAPNPWVVGFNSYLTTSSIIQVTVFIAGLITIAQYSNQQDFLISSGVVSSLSLELQAVLQSRFREGHWMVVAFGIAVPVLLWFLSFCVFASNPWVDPGKDYSYYGPYDEYYEDAYYNQDEEEEK